ncbi:MAG: hypothetical protein QW103_01445 [Candidatus Pacearchaeota archaeon]
MEKLIFLIIMTFISIFLGFIGKKISYKEKKIYKKYFPPIIIFFSILSIVFIFININKSIFFFLLALVAFVWNL